MVEELKRAILTELAASGAEVVTGGMPPSCAWRAVAELIAEDKVYDTEDACGRLMLVITRKGLEAAADAHV